MNIVFFCQSCGARFEVPSSSAGKKGRCKKCSQMMSIPEARELASMVAMPALASVGAGAGAGGGSAAVKSGNSLDWLKAASSNVGLAPLTMDRMPLGPGHRLSKPKYDDDLGDSKPYALAQPVRVGSSRPSGQVASGAKILWRSQLGGVQKLFRKLNEWAYLISVPFLLLIVLGALVNNRSLALFSATIVVLLEIGRIATGVANLAVVPFREGIFQGIMFLIPPLTFFYLSSHWKKLKKPTMRIVGPIATVTLIVLAFTFIPRLRQDGKMPSAENLQGQLRESVTSLKGEMSAEVKKAKSTDLESLGKQAEEKLRNAAGQINSIGQPAGPGAAPRP